MKKTEFWLWLVSLLLSIGWLLLAVVVEAAAWSLGGFQLPRISTATALPIVAVIAALFWAVVRRGRIFSANE